MPFAFPPESCSPSPEYPAEKKLEFGTEKKTYNSEEFHNLLPTHNPQQLEAGDDGKTL